MHGGPNSANQNQINVIDQQHFRDLQSELQVLRTENQNDLSSNQLLDRHRPQSYSRQQNLAEEPEVERARTQANAQMSNIANNQRNHILNSAYGTAINNNESEHNPSPERNNSNNNGTSSEQSEDGEEEEESEDDYGDQDRSRSHQTAQTPSVAGHEAINQGRQH